MGRIACEVDVQFLVIIGIECCICHPLVYKYMHVKRFPVIWCNITGNSNNNKSNLVKQCMAFQMITKIPDSFVDKAGNWASMNLTLVNNPLIMRVSIILANALGALPYSYIFSKKLFTSPNHHIQLMSQCFYQKPNLLWCTFHLLLLWCIWKVNEVTEKQFLLRCLL